MHRLVRDVTLHNLSNCEGQEARQGQDAKRHIVTRVCKLVPELTLDSWEIYEAYVPHMLAMSEHVTEKEFSSGAVPTAFARVGAYLELQTRYRDAECLFQAALSLNRLAPEPDERAIQELTFRIGRVNFLNGEFAAAETILSDLSGSDLGDELRLNLNALLMTIYFRLTRPSLAREQLCLADELAQELPPSYEVGKALVSIGYHLALDGQLAAATERADLGIQMLQDNSRQKELIDVDYVEALLRLSNIYMQNRQPKKALIFTDRATAACEILFPDDDHPLALLSLSYRLEIYFVRSKQDSDIHRQFHRIRKVWSHLKRNPRFARDNVVIHEALLRLAFVEMGLGLPADSTFTAELADINSLPGTVLEELVLRAEYVRSRALRTMKRFDDSIALTDRVISKMQEREEESVYFSAALITKCSCLVRAKKSTQEIEPIASQAHVALECLLERGYTQNVSEFININEIKVELAMCLTRVNQFDLANGYYTSAIEGFRGRGEHNSLATALQNYTALLLQIRDPQRALETGHEAVSLMSKNYGEGTPQHLRTLINYATVLSGCGQFIQSFTEFSRALELCAERSEQNVEYVQMIELQCSAILSEIKAKENAEAILRRALRLFENSATDSLKCLAWSALIDVLSERGLLREAIIELNGRIRVLGQRQDISCSDDVSQLYDKLGKLYEQRRELTNAVTAYQKALKIGSTDVEFQESLHQSIARVNGKITDLQ